MHYLLIGKQLTNGSPEYWTGQLQIGLWFRTTHNALCPQVLSHGFWHFWFTQALLCSQSEFTKHSGLQLGGIPKYPGRQVQEACSLNSRQMLLGPQGEGSQGFVRSIVKWHIEHQWMKHLKFSFSLGSINVDSSTHFEQVCRG